MIGQSPDDKFSDSQQGSRGPEQSVMAKRATSRRFQRRPRFIQLATLRTRTLIIHVSAHFLKLLHILFHIQQSFYSSYRQEPDNLRGLQGIDSVYYYRPRHFSSSFIVAFILILKLKLIFIASTYITTYPTQMTAQSPPKRRARLSSSTQDNDDAALKVNTYTSLHPSQSPLLTPAGSSRAQPRSPKYLPSPPPSCRSSPGSARPSSRASYRGNELCLHDLC